MKERSNTDKSRGNVPKRRRDRHALKNVISLRISDDELMLLQRLRAATSKSASEIMRDAFQILQRTCSPSFQN
jgi:hypothetical protein